MKRHFPLLLAIKCAAVLCFVFPLLPVAAALNLPTGTIVGEGWMARTLAELVLSGLCGLLCGASFVPKISAKEGQWNTLLANLLAFGAALLCAGAVLLLQRYSPAASYETAWTVWYTAGIHALLAFVSASVCCRVWEWDYGDILTNIYLMVLVGLDAACCLVYWLTKNTLPLTTLSLTLLFAACVYAAAKNQGNIDYLMEKRSSRSTSILPKRMRWYSFSLVGIIFLLIFAGYFLRRPIAGFFRWVLHLLKLLIAALLSLLPSGEPGEVVEETPQASGGSNMGLPPAEEGGGIFWTLFGIAIGVLFLWLLFYYRHEIWNTIRSILRKFRDFLQGVLFHSRAPSALADVNQYFEDNIEELSREPGNFWKREKPYDLRRWKKEYRAFQRQEDSPKKLREGYRLALMLLLLRGAPLTPADTPTEIRRKAETYLPPALLASVTDGYCRVRYAGAQPGSSDWDELSALLRAGLDKA